MLYAHSPGEERPDEWQTLDDHLRGAAKLARKFADSFDCASWGQVLGDLHDIGKASDAFQKRLHGSGEKIDHSTIGAYIAWERYARPDFGHVMASILAYAIAGHHGGIPNGIVRGSGAKASPLFDRFGRISPKKADYFERQLDELGLSIPDASELEPLPFQYRLKAYGGSAGPQAIESSLFSISVLCRMLYSCLVDADYLDTEAFMSPSIAALRTPASHEELPELAARLDDYLDRLMKKAPQTAVNRARARILDACRDAADQAPGLFTLTVPTGGGKTLSSLSFALRHAIRHGMERVIYAIPYTSIVEQTARAFREVLGAENVLEHHANFDFDDDGANGDRDRLSAQNWNAPAIVTTNVQLLESLFSNRPGKCRKLHNIARSVIVLDEAQTLPDELLKPTLAMLQDLCLDFKASVVLCTATQPSLSSYWPFGGDAREIIADRTGFDNAFAQRTEFAWEGSVESSALVNRLAVEHQVLCVAGTKAKARALYEGVAGILRSNGGYRDADTGAVDGVFHLSANMTPLHRLEVLDEVRTRLIRQERCIVVSTQLIEAGVDIDFPAVYRELAGIDSLYQAAGRCNREGARVTGVVHVFELAEDSAKGCVVAHTWLERMKGISRQLIEERDGKIDDSLVPLFFSRRYATDGGELDGKGIYARLVDRGLIQSELKTLQLETIARDYRIIEDDTRSVFVPWGPGGIKLLAEIRETIRRGVPSAFLTMKAQRSSVSVRAQLYDALRREGVLDEDSLAPIVVLRLDMDGLTYYSNEVGLLAPGKEELNELIV